MLTILLTGSVPLTSSFSDCKLPQPTPEPIGHLHGLKLAVLIPQIAVTAAASTDPEDPKAPYALPTLTITAFHHAAVGFYCYARFASVGSMSFAVASIANACLAGVGLWCVLFASSSGRISRKTGADKRTSGFPFGNKESDKKRKEGHKSL